MMMTLWKYLRKTVARELYSKGVFTDDIPRNGLLTVFFENGTQGLEGLFD